jgi:nitroreductase
MYMQTVMLLAREHGLHTCPQEIWSLFPRTVADALQMPSNLLLFSGMAVGYRDESAPINALRTERAPLEDFASLRGFDSSHERDDVGESDTPPATAVPE